MRTETIICDQCTRELDERVSSFQLTYSPSTLSTVPYGPQSTDYCSAKCLVDAVENMKAGGLLCGFTHGLDR